MFNTKSNVLKLSKRKYSNILKNKYKSSYLIHERISNNINHSTASANLDTTASRTSLTRSQINSYRKIPVNDKEKNLYKIKKCSYTDFLAVRDGQIKVPFNYTSERFKWQNIYDEHALVDPLLTTRPRKKQFLLKETFGEGLLGFINREKLPDNKPKIRRYRQNNTEVGNHIQNVDYEISRRVVNPEFNQDPQHLKKHKRSLSQTDAQFHNTNGCLDSLFNTTPMYFENKSKKKLFNHKSYGMLTINIFSKDYPQYPMPTHTKKLFYDNRCYFDTVKHDDLLNDMHICWKEKEDFSRKRRQWSLDEKCLSKKNYSLKYDSETMNLRNIKYGYSLNNWNNRSVGRIKRK